ncbi:response regulator [Streptococcus agalactiae H36B]|nr:response regulator [Streptococcus agalactiae H36B]
MDVLIIEDDPMVEFIHRNYLEKLNYFQNIYSTASQTQAIAYLNDIKIQLVLLDIHIKEGNGLELLKLLRNQHQNTEVIVISAANEAHTVKEAFHLGIFPAQY